MTLHAFPQTANDASVRDILNKALAGLEISQAEGECLFRASAAEFPEIARVLIRFVSAPVATLLALWSTGTSTSPMFVTWVASFADLPSGPKIQTQNG